MCRDFIYSFNSEYGIYMLALDSNFRNGRIREEEYNLEKNLNVMNIQLEVNKAFKNLLEPCGIRQKGYGVTRFTELHRSLHKSFLIWR